VKVTNTGVPQILNEIQARSFVYNSILKDSLLFIGANGEVEIWNVANPQNPIPRNNINIVLNDIFVKDTFLYTISEDSFKIFNVANITNPYLIGACRDSGNMVFVSGNYAYLGDRWGLYVLNVSNPQNPYRVSVLSGGAEVGSVWVEGNHCYYTTETGLKIANVRDPANPWEEGSLPSIGGSDIYKLSYFLYLPGLDIIDVGDSSNPTRISHLDLPGWENGVWANNPFGYAFVADHFEGLQIIDIHDPVNPVRDTWLLKAESAEDIMIDNLKAYVADYTMMKIIDVSNPTYPYELGSYDTIGRANIYLTTVAAKDSFAYVPWPFDTSWLRSIDVSDPPNPRFAAVSICPGVPKDMVIVDTFLYVAANYRFFIFNISNPRQPRLVGSCNSLDMTGGLSIAGSYAYIASSLGWAIINIADPSNPSMINSFSHPHGWGIAVVDTLMYFAHGYDSLIIWNVANPNAPYPISSISTRSLTYDVVVESGFAFVGTRYGLEIFDVSDPQNPRDSGFYSTPDYVRRVFYSHPYIYTACFSAGMCIFERTPNGIKETDNFKRQYNLSISPNPTNGKIKLKGINNASVFIYNIAGRKVGKGILKANSPFCQELDLSDLPNGCYIIYIKEAHFNRVGKVIINKKR
jgi:hypothetical protein